MLESMDAGKIQRNGQAQRDQFLFQRLVCHRVRSLSQSCERFSQGPAGYRLAGSTDNETGFYLHQLSSLVPNFRKLKEIFDGHTDAEIAHAFLSGNNVSGKSALAIMETLRDALEKFQPSIPETDEYGKFVLPTDVDEFNDFISRFNDFCEKVLLATRIKVIDVVARDGFL